MEISESKLLVETENYRLDPLEWSQITSQLELHHALFYQMWILGKPIFDKSIPTAGVSFDKDGDYVGFTFNPDFWKKLTLEEKMFIICHECLHVIFKHGLRGINSDDWGASNIAMDIIVNHSLVNNFSFDRDKLTSIIDFGQQTDGKPPKQLKDELCWVDTIFPGKNLPTNGTFEYYLNQMPFITIKGFKSIDDHSKLGSFDPVASDRVFEKLRDKLSQSEKDSLKNTLAGLGVGDQLMIVNPGKVKKKKKWETVIREWSKKFRKQDDDLVEQWARRARRYETLSSDLFLPSDVEYDKPTEDRIQVWFFQDTSGSCIHLKDRFFRAAKSLPKDRFDVKMHTFDTRVHEVNIDDNKIRGGGSTYFDIIETYIQKYIKENKIEYPKAIFLISDGYGTYVDPEVPENWYWFLSTTYVYYTPEKSNVYQLRDFE